MLVLFVITEYKQNTLNQERAETRRNRAVTRHFLFCFFCAFEIEMKRINFCTSLGFMLQSRMRNKQGGSFFVQTACIVKLDLVLSLNQRVRDEVVFDFQFDF